MQYSPPAPPRLSPLNSLLGVVLLELGGWAPHPADTLRMGAEELSEAIRACGGPGTGPDGHCALLSPLPTPLPLSGLGKGSSITALFSLLSSLLR